MGRALITGASSGLGAEFAWTLAAEHNDLILVARNADRLRALADKIRNVTGVDVAILPADLADLADTQRVAERLQNDDDPVTLLVNNAGFGLAQDFVGGSVERELDRKSVV